MTGGKKERSASLSLIHEQLSMGETVSTVGRRRRNGLGDIFQGLSQNDINTLRANSSSLNGRSLSCPCARGATNDRQGGSLSKQSNSKRRFHLLHNKHWARRRMALGDIFADIPATKINELLCLSLQEDSSHKLESCESHSLHQRRFALADIFSCVPNDKIEELIHGSIDNEDMRTRLNECSNSDEEYLENDVFETDSDLSFKKVRFQRRCALGNIFVDISPEEAHKLASQTNQVIGAETDVSEKNAESATENKTVSNVVPCRIKEKDAHVSELNDYQSNLYVKTFFRSLINIHQHKHRLGYMSRTMSLPCYSQYDIAQQVSTDKRRNGQGDVLSDITCQDYYSLKGKYASSVVYASC